VVGAIDPAEIALMSAFDDYANDLDDFAQMRDRLSVHDPVHSLIE